MRFTLVYDGALSTKASGQAEQKQRIREQFHVQLRELWQHQPLADVQRFLQPKASDGDLSAILDRHGMVTASVVSRSLGMAAELDVLFLRPEDPGRIISDRGDLDNRLKVLFDALAAPQQRQQVHSSARPTTIADPLYVLMDDDDQILRVNAEADRLLAETDPDRVRVTIRVTTRIMRPMWANISLV